MQADSAAHPRRDLVPVEQAHAISEAVRRPWAEGGPQMARTREIHVPTPHGPVRLRVYTPRAARPGPALLYVHGGGWVLFSLDTHDRLMREYAERAGLTVIGVDYTRAPEALPAGHRGDRRRDRLAGRPRRRTGGGSRPAVHRRRLGRRQPVGGRLPDAARARRRAAGRHGPELRRVRRQSVSRLDRQVRRRRIPAVDPADGVVLLELPARRRRSAGSAHQPGARGPARPAAGLHGHHRTRPAARHQPGHGRAPARSRRGRAGEGLSGHGAQFSGGGIAGAGQRGRLRRYRGLVARGAAAGCGGGGDPYGEHQP